MGAFCFIFTLMKAFFKNTCVKNLLRNFQLLSLDVVVGALAMGLFAVKLLQVNPNKWWWLVLALSVWAVYTSDHLIDGFSQKDLAVIQRHQIHYLFRIPLMVAIGLSSVVAVTLTFLFLNKTVIIVGVIIGFLAMLYLALVYISRKHQHYFHKEFFISLFYVAGIWLAPATAAPHGLLLFHRLTMAAIVLLVWYEGILVSTFEMEKDIRDGHNSFAVNFGREKTKFLLNILLIAIVIVILILLVVAKNETEYFSVLLETIMVLSLLSIIKFPGFFSKHEYYKTFGELIFWLPALIWFVH